MAISINEIADEIRKSLPSTFMDVYIEYTTDSICIGDIQCRIVLTRAAIDDNTDKVYLKYLLPAFALAAKELDERFRQFQLSL